MIVVNGAVDRLGLINEFSKQQTAILCCSNSKDATARK